MSKHYSTKHYGHNIGLSAVFRQPNADHSHCHLLHGYSLAFTFKFVCDKLDNNNNAEVEKKKKYADACSARRAHFTPLCFSVDGLAGTEATCFLKRMACRLSTWWDRNYAEVLGWVCA